MKSEEFYKFCKNNRKTAETLTMRQSLSSVYNYMRECSTAKKDVKEYIDLMIKRSEGLSLDITAFECILEVLEGPSLIVSTEEKAGQLLLFPQEDRVQ